jgi:peptidoglycan/xylan/chitin deacetylase (PgdA/CDA1 family)
MSEPTFRWPQGKKAALSLTFDDARESQVDSGFPILDELGVKATFYVSFAPFERRLDEWKEAASAGHEIGNHSVSHPCSGNFRFSETNYLEEYTLDRMEKELIEASDTIEGHIGIRPTTFAYPCGQTFVGRGEEARSYVPLVAKHFHLGRGFKGESPLHPLWGDMAQAPGVDFDGATFDDVKRFLNRAVDRNQWLLLAGHDVGHDPEQTVQADTLRQVCEYALNPDNGIWIDTAAKVAAYCRSKMT